MDPPMEAVDGTDGLVKEPPEFVDLDLEVCNLGNVSLVVDE